MKQLRDIVICAGHGGKDSGTVANGFIEADEARMFRNMVSLYLDRAGASYMMDGTREQNQDRLTALKLVSPKRVCVEFHLNSVMDTTAHGTETLGRDNTRALGTDLCVAISEALGTRNRGAKPDNAGQHSGLAFAGHGGLVVELFFCSNLSDCEKYRQKHWLAARAVADVLIKHAALPK